MPQIILSFAYFSYNSFLTRLQVEREWQSFALSHTPLRVSNPVGKQVSSYRLQLPYKFSIPLITICALLHWIMSNAVFLYIVEGGKTQFLCSCSYSTTCLTAPGFWHMGSMTGLSGLTNNAQAVMDFSAPAILSLLVTSSVLVSLAVVLSLWRVPSAMISGGSNSLVLSAACHTSTKANSQSKSNACTRKCTSFVDAQASPSKSQTGSPAE